jgi:hypothetical protein
MHAYAPRPVSWLGIEHVRGWRIKRYAIVYGDVPLDPRRFEGGLPLSRAALPAPAVSAARPGVAIEILHQGRTADYLVLGWWDNENELPLRVFVRSGAVLGGSPDVEAYVQAAATVAR